MADHHIAVAAAEHREAAIGPQGLGSRYSDGPLSVLRSPRPFRAIAACGSGYRGSVS